MKVAVLPMNTEDFEGSKVTFSWAWLDPNKVDCAWLLDGGANPNTLLELLAPNTSFCDVNVDENSPLLIDAVVFEGLKDISSLSTHKSNGVKNLIKQTSSLYSVFNLFS